jgi:hypothetical protein
MPRHTFPYTEKAISATPAYPSGWTVRRPLLVARLTASNGNIFVCLVWPDSGADGCAFPLSYAIAMKLDPLQLKQQIAGGVGNAGNVAYHDNLKIELANLADYLADPTKFNPLVSFDAYVAFTSGLEAQGLGLLGQSGFFENYVVTFDYKKREFHIE